LSLFTLYKWWKGSNLDSRYGAALEQISGIKGSLVSVIKEYREQLIDSFKS